MNDIEVLEDIVQEVFEFGNNGYEMNRQEVKALHNLLKERQSDKERIKDLEEINEAHKKENGELREEIKYWKEQAQGYSDLSKQIKEEYEQRLEDYYNEE